MRVIYKKPGKPPETIHIDNTLDALRGAVGGHIEVINMGCAAVIVNEESKLLGLPENFFLTPPNGVKDMICGPAVFCSLDDEDFGDVPRSLEALIMSEWRAQRVRRAKKRRTVS